MDPEFAARYVEFEKSHWWFRARRRILHALLDRHVEWDRVRTLLEVGVGSGANLAELYPAGVELTGIEPDAQAAELARQRGLGAIHTGTLEEAERFLGEERFDVITLFDVLEHIQEDRTALRVLFRHLAPGGWLILTVPAYQWLWSSHDEVNHHYRRYTRAGLVERVREAGFELGVATYFNTFLFPAVAATRLAARLRSGSRRTGHASDLALPRAGINALLFRVFASERSLLTRCSLPFGVSLFLLARRSALLTTVASIDHEPLPILT